MSILITGGGGFVGHNLVDSLLAKNYSVLYPFNKELDLTDPEAVEKYLKDHVIECIVHCATERRDGTTYPLNTCEVNLRMFFNLLKYKNPSAKLINLGSGSEYARGYWHKKMPEEYFDTYVPQDSHSYSKYLISKYIKEMGNENLICLRLFGLFGKYEDYRYKFISNSIVRNLLKMPITINQNVVYDYLYIADFSRIIEHFLGNKAWTNIRIFNVTPTEPIDLLAIANIINKVSSYKSEIQVLNEGIGVEYSGDNKKLLAEIGDFQFTAPEVAIADLYEYYATKKDSLDRAAIIQNDYLNYAEMLRTNYFNRGIKNETDQHNNSLL